MNKEKLKKIWEVFTYFFRISWFTFGGGWSIVAQMQKDYVEQKRELTDEELLDIVSVGRSLPGTMIGNVAYLFGYRQAGILGGVLSVVGMVLPPMLILSVLTYCYVLFQENISVSGLRWCPLSSPPPSSSPREPSRRRSATPCVSAAVCSTWSLG